jgi:SNF2 family DNA or RNA helicase
VTKDFSKDKEALESRPVTKVTDDDGGDALQEDPADDLIAGLAKLAVSASIRTCSICQSRYACSTLLLLERSSDPWFIRLDSGNSSPGENTCNDCAAQLARQQRRTSLVTSNSSLPPSSAKIRKVLELLRRIRDRGEGEKTIIFSQFTSWLDLFDPFLREEGMKFVRRK